MKSQNTKSEDKEREVVKSAQDDALEYAPQTFDSLANTDGWIIDDWTPDELESMTSGLLSDFDLNGDVASKPCGLTRKMEMTNEDHEGWQIKKVNHEEPKYQKPGRRTQR